MDFFVLQGEICAWPNRSRPQILVKSPSYSAFLQVVKAIGEAARNEKLEARKQALIAVQVFASEAAPVLAPHFADVAPVLLDCACDASREARPPPL